MKKYARTVNLEVKDYSQTSVSLGVFSCQNANNEHEKMTMKIMMQYALVSFNQADLSVLVELRKADTPNRRK